jgi:hypothetical protein
VVTSQDRKARIEGHIVFHIWGLVLRIDWKERLGIEKYPREISGL